MDLADRVRLIRGGVEGGGSSWADLGSGAGAFTLALAEIIGAKGRICSLDMDARALREQEREMRARFPELRVEYVRADITRLPALPQLDGVVAANSLHYVRLLSETLHAIAALLRPGGRIVVVEYELDRPNPWVPHPIPFTRWEREARACGFQDVRLLARRPSRFNGEMYSAVSTKSE